MQKIIFFLVLLCSLGACGGRNNAEQKSKQPRRFTEKQPKREVRAVWLVTVLNKDFPTKRGLPTEIQKKQLTIMLDYLAQKGINTIFFQVRSACDAFYQSRIEPWSEWITGIQGEPPIPFYDPLQMLIEEAHKRNIEVHAWFNPYRAILNNRIEGLSSSHIINRYPEWLVDYGKQTYLNPALPEVRKYVQLLIMDVVLRYDIDGVHFDDYFYPYNPHLKQDFEDEIHYLHFRKSIFISKADWRRQNVNELIQMVAKGIKTLKPHVKFGISPIAVWRNQQDDKKGSLTKARTTAYDQLYADIRLWLEKGWIDYVAPQLYISLEDENVDYNKIIGWWAENLYGRHLYIGLAYYKIGENSQQNTNDKEWNTSVLPMQMHFNRSNKAVKGHIFYSTKDFAQNRYGITDTLRNDFFAYPALLPTMEWKDNIPPLKPQKANSLISNEKITLTWHSPPPAKDKQKAYKYVIYRFKNNEKVDLENPKYILSIQKDTVFVDKIPIQNRQRYTYYITALDRLQNESEPLTIEVLEK
ncbi:MAG: hypothetical protein EAZ55_09290 [Cytophagales bacterium]|nr:MAG: hypothetical protein EAZ55_09290 [Cytophagales bacterium]